MASIFSRLFLLISVFFLILLEESTASNSNIKQVTAGRFFFCSVNQHSGVSHINSIKADGTDPQNHVIIDSKVRFFSFSPMAMRAVFMIGSTMYVMSLETFSFINQIPDMNCCEIDLSLDGRWAACLRFDRNIRNFLILIDLENLDSLKESVIFESPYIKSFKFSKDGQSIHILAKENMQMPKLLKVDLENTGNIVETYQLSFSDFVWSKISADGIGIIILQSNGCLAWFTVGLCIPLYIPARISNLIPIYWSNDSNFIYLEHSGSSGGSNLVVLKTDTLNFIYPADSNKEAIKIQIYDNDLNECIENL